MNSLHNILKNSHAENLNSSLVTTAAEAPYRCFPSIFKYGLPNRIRKDQFIKMVFLTA